MKVRLWEMQDNLREHIRGRIQHGDVTGVALARRAGLRQAHISNFLNQRRGLSLQSMDQLLEALGLDLLDLLEFDDQRRAQFDGSGSHARLEIVPVVSLQEEAHQPHVPFTEHREIVSFRRAFLRRIRPRVVGDRRHWERFVVAQPDGETVRSMQPRISAGANLLIDRCYNSLQPYRNSRQNLYAVRAGARTVIGYVDLAEDLLLVRPHNRDASVEVITVGRDKGYAQHIVGRICHIGCEV